MPSVNNPSVSDSTSQCGSEFTMVPTDSASDAGTSSCSFIDSVADSTAHTITTVEEDDMDTTTAVELSEESDLNKALAMSIVPLTEGLTLDQGQPLSCARVLSEGLALAKEQPAVAQAPVVIPFDETVLKNLFMGENTLQGHLNFARKWPAAYAAEFGRIEAHGITITVATRSRVLATAWSTHQHTLLNGMLNDNSLGEVVKAAQLLDCQREARAVTKRIARLEKITGVGEKKMKFWRQKLHNLQKENHNASASGAFARRIRKWTASIPAERLEFFLMNYSKKPWKQLADICHLKKSDFALPYFLPCVYGKAAPEGTLVNMFTTMNATNVAAMIEQYPVLATMWSSLRQKFEKKAKFPANAKLMMLHQAPLEDIIWFYEELSCEGGDEMIKARLQKEEIEALHSRSNYGKLMERLMTFQDKKCCFANLLLDHAQKRLDQLTREIKARGVGSTVVIGDMSSSMTVAVRAAAIMGSLLTATLNAELIYFNTKAVYPPLVPRNAREVVKVSNRMKAGGATSPAAALWPFYEQQLKRDLFIVVTDEEENTECNGHRFAPLFKKYLDEVNPSAKVLLVSFLSNHQNEGYMKKELLAAGVEAQQFKLDQRRPDLSRFDTLLSQVMTDFTNVTRTPVH